MGLEASWASDGTLFVGGSGGSSPTLLYPLSNLWNKP